MHHPTQQNM